jgi:hypothetical protein
VTGASGITRLTARPFNAVRERAGTLFAASFTEIARQFAPNSSSPLVRVCYILFGFVLAGGMEIIVNGARKPSVIVPPQLNLRALREENGNVRFKWNTEIPQIRDARFGVLRIADGDYKHQEELDRVSLQSGGVSFQPRTDEVTISLDVIGRTQNISEWLLLISPSPANPVE